MCGASFGMLLRDEEIKKLTALAPSLRANSMEWLTPPEI
jgi:hypothetical protein